MYSPIKLIVRDFISHTDTTFVFKQDVLTLIFGKNEDDLEEGANSNGSGKSVVIEAITLSLTGETYRDVNKEDVIQDGKKEAYSYFELYNDFLKEKFVIERWIKKSSSICKVTINDIEQKQLTGVPEANKFILEKIGVSKEDLLNFFIINQDNSSSFFTNNDSKQKEIISRFIDTTIVESAIKKIELEKSLIVKRLTEENNFVFKIESNIEELETLIQEEINSLESDSNEVVIDFKNEKAENEKGLELKKQSILKIEESIDRVTKVCESLKKEIEDFSSFKELKKQIRKELSETEDEKNKNDSEVRKVELKLREAIECPKCKHGFVVSSHKHEDLDVIKKSLIETKNKTDKFKEQIEELNSELDTVNLELVKMDEITVNLEKQSSIVSDSNRRKNTFEKDVLDLIKRNKTIDKKIEDILNEEKEESKIPIYETKKTIYEKQLTELKIKITTTEKELEQKEYQLFHLGKKGFLTYLANESIKTIENYCNVFLNKMNTNLNVKINGYKILGNGEVRDKIEVFIVKNGITKGKFDKYSGGQKERVKLSSILTFFSLINNGLNGKGLNLLCLDESLDHLDELGQKKCLELLKMFNITTLVITHGHAETLLDGYNKVVVKYKNKESSIL